MAGPLLLYFPAVSMNKTSRTGECYLRVDAITSVSGIQSVTVVDKGTTTAWGVTYNVVSFMLGGVTQWFVNLKLTAPQTWGESRQITVTLTNTSGTPTHVDADAVFV